MECIQLSAFCMRSLTWGLSTRKPRWTLSNVSTDIAATYPLAEQRYFMGKFLWWSPTYQLHSSPRLGMGTLGTFPPCFKRGVVVASSDVRQNDQYWEQSVQCRLHEHSDRLSWPYWGVFGRLRFVNLGAFEVHANHGRRMCLVYPHAKWVVGSNAPSVGTVSFLAWKKAEKKNQNLSP